MYLADRFDARIVGITISPIQAAMAGQLAGRNRSGRCAFAAMDAEAMAIQDQFDIVWSVEALSHMPNRNRVLGDAIALLRPGGKVGVIDWFKAPSITPSDERAYLHPLERGMLVHHLATLREYARQIQALGCRLIIQEDLTANVAKTWDICSNLARLPSLLQMAQDHGPDCVRFLQSFHVMRAALQAGVFKYGLITAEKRVRL
jgi:tocopherol O-methyltransferase